MSEEYSQKEEDTFRKDLFKQLDRIESDGKETKIQTTAHNGRMTKIEVKISDYEEIKQIVNEAKGFKTWVSIILSIFLTLGSGIGYLFLQNVYAINADNTRAIIEQEKENIIKSATGNSISAINLKYNLNIPNP